MSDTPNNPSVPTPDASLLSLLISEAEACRLMNLGRRTLKTMRDEGQIPFVRARKRVLYSRAALMNWIAEHTEGGPKA